MTRTFPQTTRCLVALCFAAIHVSAERGEGGKSTPAKRFKLNADSHLEIGRQQQASRQEGHSRPQSQGGVEKAGHDAAPRGHPATHDLASLSQREFVSLNKSESPSLNQTASLNQSGTKLATLTLHSKQPEQQPSKHNATSPGQVFTELAPQAARIAVDNRPSAGSVTASASRAKLRGAPSAGNDVKDLSAFEPLGSSRTCRLWTFLGACFVASCVALFVFVRTYCCIVPREDLKGRPAARAYNLPAWVAKADAVFVACDSSRKGTVGFEELTWLARHSGRALTWQGYLDLCRALGANTSGLTLEEFRHSYSLLGHDVDYDWAVVQRATRDGCSPSGVPVVTNLKIKKGCYKRSRRSSNSPSSSSQLASTSAGWMVDAVSAVRALLTRA